MLALTNKRIQKKWIPEQGRRVWFIFYNGDIVSSLWWPGNKSQKECLKQGRLCRTRKEAREKLRKIKKVLKGE